MQQESQHSMHIYFISPSALRCTFCFTSLRRSLSVTAQVGRNTILWSKLSFCHPTVCQKQPDKKYK